MSLATHWECGTKISRGNAFDVAPFVPVISAADRRKQSSRTRWDKKLAARGLTRADTAKAKAERINKTVNLSAHCERTESAKAPR